MAYSTEFVGYFRVSPALEPAHAAYLTLFSQTKRMKRDNSKLENVRDTVRDAVGLPLGQDGEFFVAATGFLGQDKHASIVKSSEPPAPQPTPWCIWGPGEGHETICWNGHDNIYSAAAVTWLKYLIARLLSPWGYKLNGKAKWQGDGKGDRGMIIIEDNMVTVRGLG